MNKLKEFLILFVVLTLVLSIIMGLYGYESGYDGLSTKDILVYLFGTFVSAAVLSHTRSEPKNMG